MQSFDVIGPPHHTNHRMQELVPPYHTNYRMQELGNAVI